MIKKETPMQCQKIAEKLKQNLLPFLLKGGALPLGKTATLFPF